MNQSIFLLSDDFFNNSYDEISQVASEINSGVTSEKLILVYDPISLSFFEKASKFDRDLFELVLLDFFLGLGNLNKLNLPWYSLDEDSSSHINYLGELIMLLEHNTRGIYTLGVIPVKHSFEYFVFFFISPYSIPDKYHILSVTQYNKALSNCFINFQKLSKEKHGKACKL